MNNRRLGLAGFGLLFGGLLAYWLLAFTAGGRLGFTADEPVHLIGGHTYWRFGDYRLHPENGNLAQRIVAAPLSLLDLNFPPEDSPNWQEALAPKVANDFLFHSGNDPDSILRHIRAAAALVGVLVVALTWLWARRLFGPRAGWLALALAVLCPTLLAHGGLATSDMTITAALLLALGALWRLLHHATPARVLLAGLACGAAFLAKMSGVLIAPLAVALLLLRALRGGALPLGGWLGHAGRLRGRISILAGGTGLLCAVGVIALATLWTGYGFRYSTHNPDLPYKGDGFYFDWDIILEEASMPAPPQTEFDLLREPLKGPSPTAMTRLLGVMREHRLLPEAYLWGFAQTYKFSRVRQAFLNGRHSRTGWPEFFPWTFWLKTSPSLLALLPIGALALARRKSTGENPPVARLLWRAAPLLLFVVVYGGMAMNMKLNIGHRHILPLYPILIVFASASIFCLPAGRLRLGAPAILLALALGIHAIESWRIRPWYIAYFQPLAVPSGRGYDHLVDSSSDWGQGLPEFSRWIDARRAEGEHSPVYLTYFGADNPAGRRLDVTRFGDEVCDLESRVFPAHLRGGWFVISATFYQGVYTPIRGPWTREFEAVYQRLGVELRSAKPQDVAPDSPMRESLYAKARDYECAQFGRIRHFLRSRRPQTVLAESLLVFKLTDAEVGEALYGPPPFHDPEGS